MNDLLLYIVLVLAIARLTLIIVRDDIFKPIRHIIFLFSPPENDERSGLYYQNYIRSTKSEKEITRASLRGLTMMAPQTVGSNIFERQFTATDMIERKPGWWGQVFSCPDCCGIYVATAYLTAYNFFPQEILLTAYVLAASMMVSLIARRY